MVLVYLLVRERRSGVRTPGDLKQALAHAGTAMWEWDVEADRIEWSDDVRRIYGLDRSATLDTFAELLERTDWSRYGRRSGNPKCQDCMVHCGYEPTAVDHAFTVRGMLRTARAALAP